MSCAVAFLRRTCRAVVPARRTWALGALGIAAATSSGAGARAGAQSAASGTSRGEASARRNVAIRLNGRLVATGSDVRSTRGEEILIAVNALRRAIEGDVSTDQGAQPVPRLRVDGKRLFASTVGGCTVCPARVARPVVISVRVRALDGVLWFPLADLVTAFDGRLEVDAARSVYGIHAGKCTWCILEPQ